MAVQFQPPPTYADPVVYDQATRKQQFNPIWLKWFLDVAQYISANGGGGAIQHNSLGGLQGGLAASSEFYHLTNNAYTILKNIASPTAGSVAYGTGSEIAFTAAGSAGQVLTSAGAGVPVWTTLATTSGTSILYGNGSGGFSNVTIGSGVSFVGGVLSATGSGGTVTSVTGTSPVVSSGGTTPAISLATGYGDTQNPYASKTANYFLAAPNGSAGVPTFRAMVATDVPALSYVSSVSATAPITSTGGLTPTIGVTSAALTKTDDTNVTLTLGGTPATSLLAATSLTLGWTGQLAVGRGGTGVNTTPANGQLLIGNGTGYTVANITAGSNITVTNTAGGISIASSNPGGTVTSVGLSMPSQFTVTNSPVTGSGTLTAAWNNQTTNYVFAGPATGAAAAPTFRALVAADIPTLSYVTSVTGTSPVVSSGGTAPAISLASGYGDTQNPYASKTANYVLAAPNGSAGVPTFRALVAADVPALPYQPTAAPATYTANFSVATTDVWVINNKSGSSCTATLPTASSYTGRTLYFINYQAQTLVSASSNVVPLVGGAAGTAILNAVAGDTCTLVSNGTNWVMTQYTPNNVLLLE